VVDRDRAILVLCSEITRVTRYRRSTHSIIAVLLANKQYKLSINSKGKYISMSGPLNQLKFFLTNNLLNFCLGMSSENNASSVSPVDASLVPSKKTMKGPRKKHPLPPELVGVSEKDFQSFTLAMEVDTSPTSETSGEEFLVVQGFKTKTLDAEGKEKIIVMKELSLDHLREIAKSVGVTNTSSMNKFVCRKQLAVVCQYQAKLLEKGLKATSYSARLTSNICRAVNVVFSSEFYNDFAKVNDRKTRADHEGDSTHKMFWVRAATAYNTINTGDDLDSLDSEDEFCKLVYNNDDVHLYDLDHNPEINLQQVDTFTTEAFKKKIITLFKVRTAMKRNMTLSGEHGNDPWDFIQVAMKEITGLTKIGVYYFYMRCEDNPSIDGAFQPFLDSSLKGSTVDIGQDNSSQVSSIMGSAKKRKQDQVYDGVFAVHGELMTKMGNHHSKIEEHNERMEEHQQKVVNIMEEQNKKMEDANQETKRNNNFRERFELAKALNDFDELKLLMEEAKNNRKT
jgi:hypothetical protein